MANEMITQHVTLTMHELDRCAWVGERRYEYAVVTNRNPGLGSSANLKGPGNHIVGAETEYAASIMLNMYWRPSIGQLDQKDVGGLVEVRSTDLAHGRLIVKPKAKGPYALVIKNSTQDFTWGGWILAAVAIANFKLETRYGDPAHFVPQSALGDMASLLALVRPK